MDAHILVVEDSPTQSLILSQVLQDAGFQVVTVSDGRDALLRLGTHIPMLVISDVTMPGMDGFNLCRAIRADPRIENLPILLLTNLTDEEKVLAGLEAGADAFISKPFDSARLIARVEDLLEGNGKPDTASGGEVLFAKKWYRILADRNRILRYLISTYDNAVQINARLLSSEAKLRDINSILEERVQARTSALSEEIERRKHAQAVVQVTNRLLEVTIRHREREPLLAEFTAEVKSFSGCQTVIIRLRDHRADNAPEASDGTSASDARISIHLGQEILGDILLSDRNADTIAADTVQVLEAASTQLAAALKRIEVEQTLRESEEKYRRFFEDDLAGALILTPDGVIRSCNPAFARMFGFADTATAVGSSVISLYQDPKGWVELLVLLKRDGSISTREAEYRRKDGAALSVISSAIGKRDDAGDLAEVRQYLLDITEQKGLEQQLFQSQKMEAIGRLSGSVAHDFNNILQIIQGFTDHLLNKTPAEDARHNWLKQIRVATEKATTLTQSLLAFSRKQELHPAVLSLNSVIQELAPMLRQLLGENVELCLELSSTLGEVSADRTQIDQMLVNLAANARDAMPHGGKLIYGTSNVELHSWEPGMGSEKMHSGRQILLAVRDTGDGMDRETMEHMFEPFFTTKDKGKGTGLGLATVYGAVKQAGGTIMCNSVPGQGTEFRIHLPRIGTVV
jgi:PAS domain S-box-containing protein